MPGQMSVDWVAGWCGIRILQYLHGISFSEDKKKRPRRISKGVGWVIHVCSLGIGFDYPLKRKNPTSL